MSVIFYPNYIMYSGFDATAEPSNAGETYTCSGGETTGVLYDLIDNRRSAVCTWDSNGQSVVTTVRIDLTSETSNTFCILDNHNMNTCDVDIDIEQGGANITLSSSYSGTLNSALTADSAAGTPDADGMTLILFGAVPDTQWEIEMNNAEPSFGGNIYLGEIVLGTSFEPSWAPKLQPTFNFSMPGSSYRESEGGEKYGYSTHTSHRRSWHLTWEHMTSAEKTSLETVFEVTGGVKYPLYVDLADILGIATPQLYRIRFMQDLSFKGLSQNAWQADVFLEEEI